LPRPDWSRTLPRPLTAPTVMKLSTLADVRNLVDKHLPEQYRRKPTWWHVSTEIAKALRVVAAGAEVLSAEPWPDANALIQRR
jgi:hypothetical protein